MNSFVGQPAVISLWEQERWASASNLNRPSWHVNQFLHNIFNKAFLKCFKDTSSLVTTLQCNSMHNGNMKHSHTIYNLYNSVSWWEHFFSPYSVLVGCQAFREIGQGGSESWNLESPSQGMLQQQTPHNDLKFVHHDP